MGDAKQEADGRANMIVQANTAMIGPDGLPRRDIGLPTLNGEAVASLTTCNTNLNRTCDFHMAQKFQIYLQQWRSPAPAHCQRRGRPVEPAPALFYDRLGVNMEPVCDSLT